MHVHSRSQSLRTEEKETSFPSIVFQIFVVLSIMSFPALGEGAGKTVFDFFISSEKIKLKNPRKVTCIRTTRTLFLWIRSTAQHKWRPAAAPKKHTHYHPEEGRHHLTLIACSYIAIKFAGKMVSHLEAEHPRGYKEESIRVFVSFLSKIIKKELKLY